MKPLLEQYADVPRADFAVTEVGDAVRRMSAGPLIEGYAADKGAMPAGHRLDLPQASRMVTRLG